VAICVLLGIAARGDLAEEAERPRFVGALTSFAGESQGSLCEGERVLEPVGGVGGHKTAIVGTRGPPPGVSGGSGGPTPQVQTTVQVTD
jgi:hypothetical protein